MKAKTIDFSSAKGIAVFPYLSMPDTQFHPEGRYQTKLKMSEADAKPLMEKIKGFVAQEFGDKASKAAVPFDKIPETGEIEFKTWTNYKPEFLTASLHVIPEDQVPAIYGGSTIQIAGDIKAYNVNANQFGVRLQLTQVKIVELSQRQRRNEFSAEDGFELASNDNVEAADEADGASYNF